jgi:hypothetical protein
LATKWPEIILVLETNLILISAFKKNDHLVSDYLNWEKHFNDNYTKDNFFFFFFKIIITASLLSIGGFLVVTQQMNIDSLLQLKLLFY